MDILIYIAIIIISAIVSTALAPKPPSPKPAALTDFDVPTAEEGRPYVVIFGRGRISGPNVAWYGDLSTEKIKSKAKKKG